MTKISSKGLVIRNQKCNACFLMSVPSWQECRKGVRDKMQEGRKEQKPEEDTAMITPFHREETPT